MLGRTTSALILTYALSAAGMSQSFKDALPADTMMFVTIPNINQSLEEMQQMPLAKIWRESEVQDFFADALKLAQMQWDKGLAEGREAFENGAFPVDPDDILKLRLNGISFATTSMAFLESELGEPMPSFGMLAHLEFGDSAPTWRKLLETGLAMALQQAPEGAVVRSSSQVGNIELHTLAPEERGIPIALNYAFVGSGLVIGTLTDEVRSFISNLAEGRKALTGTKDYQTIAAQLTIAGAEAEVFIRPGSYIDVAMDALRLAADIAPGFPPELDPDGIDRAIDALGLRCIKGIGSTSTYAEDRCVSQSYVLAPAPERRGFFASGTKEIELDFLKWVPKDAVSVSGATFEVMSIYDALIGGLKAYNEDFAEMVLGRLSQVEEQVGLTIKEDLFGAFGDQVVSWQMPLSGMSSFPESAYLIKVRDQERLMKTINTISQLSQGKFEITKKERRGITSYQVSFDIDFGGQLPINPLDMITPTFAFKNGFMILGMSTGDIKRTFRRMDREDDPSGDIRTNEEFAALYSKLPEQGLTSLAFTDWRGQFEGIYQALTSIIVFLPIDEDIPIDLSLLPDSATLTEHLAGSLTWSTADGNGYRTTSLGPWGPETVAILVGAVATGAAVFANFMNERR